jgi:hypothetical protein
LAANEKTNIGKRPNSLMKKKKIIFFISFTLLAFGAWLTYNHFLTSKEPQLNPALYPAQLDTIQRLRHQLKASNASVAQLEKAFIKSLTQRVFPYWYGTDWDFNGTTETPHKGNIACGYFVTTTLQQAGVPLNRVKLAQCASEEMIRALVSKTNIHHLSNMTLSEFERKLNSYGNGLYIIGLDNHTGFIWLSDKGHFFIHSSGWFPFKVVKDKVSESSVLKKSNYRVVGKISADEPFLKKWVNAP